MDFAALLRDNPVLVKHIRARLRRQQVVPSLITVVLVALIITWGGASAGALQNGYALMFLLWVQGAILYMSGTSQVSNTVSYAKETGILDFHRISPQPPLALAVGFLLGAPIREYLLFAATLPFSFFFALAGAVSPLGMLMLLVDTLVVALLYHSAALVGGLVSNRSRNVGNSVIALIFILHMFGGLTTPGLLTLMPTFREATDAGRAGMPPNTFFGFQISDFVLSLLHQVPLFVFLMIAAVRRFRHERAYFYAKPTAVAFHATVAFLVLGDVVGLRDAFDGAPIYLPTTIAVYVLGLAGIALTSAVTPAAGDFAKGVRRARKAGLSRPPIWSDLSANWAPMVFFSAILLATAFLAASLSTAGSGWSARPIASAVTAACVVVYFASARQSFSLMFPKTGAGYLALLLFVLWLLPLAAGAIAALSRMPEEVIMTVLSISPLAGIGLAALSPYGGVLPPTAGVSVATSLLLAIAFLQLRARAERKAAEASGSGR